jgi:methionyl aminopeptidase
MSITIKTPEQIDGIRKSCKLAADTVRFIRPFVVPGVSTDELDRKCQEFIADNGGISACLGYQTTAHAEGYPKSICTSINEVICHGVPNPEHILKEGDIIGIDVCTVLNGYYGDTCYTFPVGTISEKARTLLACARECLERGVRVCGPDRRFGNIGHAVSTHALKNKFSVVTQFVGHGVGLALHEPPHVYHVAKRDTGPLMKPGMIFTVEPMINEGRPEPFLESDNWTARTRDKKLSAQYEYTVLITEKGYEILTSFEVPKV